MLYKYLVITLLFNFSLGRTKWKIVNSVDNFVGDVNGYFNQKFNNNHWKQDVSESIEPEVKRVTRNTIVDPLIVAAVGRVARLGELYDARTDQFLRISMLKSNLNDSFIRSTDNRYTNIKYLKLNTLEEKLNSLDIRAEIKLSALFGMIELEGSGKFLNDKLKSARSVKVSMANLMTTQFDQIDLIGVDERKMISLDILSKIDATHVVVGIQWGGNVFISVEDTNNQNNVHQSVQGSLGVKLERLYVSVSGSGEVKVNESLVSELSKFSFEVYGDVLPREMPSTLVDAMVLMKNSSTLLAEGNNGKGKALSYTLLPTSLFRNLFNLEVNINSMLISIDESTIHSCVKLFEEINVVEQKISDLTMNRKTFKNYITKEKLDKVILFSDNYKAYNIQLKRNLSAQLIMVRSGNETIDKLNVILDEAYKHKLSPDNIDFEQFSSIEKEFKFLNHLSDLGVIILDKSTSFEEFMSMNFNKKIYAFFYKDEFPKLSEPAMTSFRNMLDDKIKFNAGEIFVAIKFDVLRKNEREIYFNFNAPSRLRMYKNGNFMIDNYVYGSLDFINSTAYGY